MASTVPNLYLRLTVPARASLLARVIAFAIAVGALAVLLTATRITPSASGMGTHLELGLQNCGFLSRTGLPCPSCGMTTSFAHFVRGNAVASAYVQPMGFVLAVLAALAVWGGAYIAITGRPAYRVLRALPGVPVVVGLFVIAIGGWAWKIFIHLRGVDGWG
jgi:hypothetical protein